MKNTLFKAAAVIALALSFVSCNNDEKAPTYKDIRWVLEQPTERFGNTLKFDWEYKEPPTIDLWFLVETYLKSPSAFSLEGEKMDAEHFFATVFNGLMFYSDGCATAFYKPEPYLPTMDWKETAPKNVVTYSELAEKNTIYLKPDLDIIEGILAEEIGTEEAEYIIGIAREVLPNSIETNYTLSRDKFSLYLTKESITPILTVLIPLIGMPELVDELNACIENTGSLQLGFNFHK